MAGQTIDFVKQTELRSRALSQLTRHNGPGAAPASASAALGVLYQLAADPETAADALALLHELQVHQIEVELQDEELRTAGSDLEAALARQIQLYDASPAGQVTIDAGLRMVELNLTAARLFGVERDALLGRALDGFFAPASSRALHAMLASVGEGPRSGGRALQLQERDGEARSVIAAAQADPAGGGRFLVTLVEAGAPPGSASASGR